MLGSFMEQWNIGMVLRDVEAWTHSLTERFNLGVSTKKGGSILVIYGTDPFFGSILGVPDFWKLPHLLVIGC